MWQQPVMYLILIVALVAWMVWANINPTRCPLCHRINLFRRKKTGTFLDHRDNDGVLIRRSVEFTCARCSGRYWIDFTA
jgi:hypothetical protein